VIKPGDEDHSPDFLDASWLSRACGIRRIAFPIGEDTGVLVVHCVSLSDSVQWNFEVCVDSTPLMPTTSIT